MDRERGSIRRTSDRCCDRMDGRGEAYHRVSEPSIEVPHPQGLVDARRYRADPVRRHAPAHDPLSVPFESVQALPGIEVPHPHGCVAFLPSGPNREKTK